MIYMYMYVIQTYQCRFTVLSHILWQIWMIRECPEPKRSIFPHLKRGTNPRFLKGLPCSGCFYGGSFTGEQSLYHCWFSISCHTLIISICCSWKILASVGDFQWHFCYELRTPLLLFSLVNSALRHCCSTFDLHVTWLKGCGIYPWPWPRSGKGRCLKNELKLVKCHSFPAHFN